MTARTVRISTISERTRHDVAAQAPQLPEPLLGFGYQQRMEHPKDGLFLFGPLEDGAHPAEMRIGVIGTLEGLGHFRTWTKRICGHIPSANADAAHHASWPGFEAVFDTRWPDRPIAEIAVDADALANAIRDAIAANFEQPLADRRLGHLAELFRGGHRPHGADLWARLRGSQGAARQAAESGASPQGSARSKR